MIRRHSHRAPCARRHTLEVSAVRWLAAGCVAVLAAAGCSVTESTRTGGLVPPANTVAADSAPVVVTVSPDDDLAAAISGTSRASATRAPQTGKGETPETSPAAPASTTDTPEAAALAVLAAAVPLEGFREGLLGVSGPAGTVVWPVIVADTPAARQRGLMGVADFDALGGYAAMVFVFGDDTGGAFWMRDTPLPLRITFVAADGSVDSVADMVPCLAPTPADECERYFPAGSYRLAIEHPVGLEHDLGLAEADFVEVTVE